MPRYFFNVRDSVEVPDEHGVELQDDDAARDVAVVASAEAIRDLGARFWDHETWRMIVTDQQGAVVAQLDFSGWVRKG